MSVGEFAAQIEQHLAALRELMPEFRWHLDGPCADECCTELTGTMADPHPDLLDAARKAFPFGNILDAVIEDGHRVVLGDGTTKSGHSYDFALTAPDDPALPRTHWRVVEDVTAISA
jgi:hypothetical protein